MGAEVEREETHAQPGSGGDLERESYVRVAQGTGHWRADGRAPLGPELGSK